MDLSVHPLAPDLRAALQEHEARITRALAASSYNKIPAQFRTTPPNSARSNISGDQFQAPGVDALTSAIRSAIRAELGDLFAEGGHMRHAMRGEVDAALKCFSGQSSGSMPPPPTVQIFQQNREPMQGQGVDEDSEREADSPTKEKLKTSGTADTFNKIVVSMVAKGNLDRRPTLPSESVFVRVMPSQLLALWTWHQELVEPPRAGCLADIVQGSIFQTAISMVIICNVAFMVYCADLEIQNPSEFTETVEFGNMVFLVVYTVEVILKLVVHRQWLFCNASWKSNVFDFGLVLAGYLSLLVGSNTSTYLRAMRFFKFGKLMRAFRAMGRMRQLRAILLCLQGSVESFFWSMFLLSAVYILFAIILMQSVTVHLKDSGEALEEAGFDELFGSFEKTMLTLYMASSGGDDWSNAYKVIRPTGFIGRAAYLFFIAFVQFAFFNIINGIFVDSAMSVLSPDDLTLAKKHLETEREHAKKLLHLCENIDYDKDGKLTKAEFADGLQEKNIPMLLTMLGLQRHHLLEFFDLMAVHDDDGMVDINRFVEGCMSLKGSATNFDILKLQAHFRLLNED